MRTILLVFLSVLAMSVTSQSVGFGDNAQVYLVRHAEKEAGNDPLLTSAGYKRAGDLARTLSAKKITRIYTTGYKRTTQTGDSLHLLQAIPVVTYAADTTGADLMQKIAANGDTDKNILIIGHSNTVPMLINKLGLPTYPTAYLPDLEFDNLFLLTFKAGKAMVLKSKYGVPSGASAPMH
ncbi:MAG: histidine phosphatase family protein [Ferruginibacter sp.]|nr:histidine phosphatase family protein [Ferruginibacter sp.]